MDPALSQSKTSAHSPTLVRAQALGSATIPGRAWIPDPRPHVCAKLPVWLTLWAWQVPM